MCTFDSPVGRCEEVKGMVLLDETQAECAREHGCPPGTKCPLDGCFVTVSGISEAVAEAMATDMAEQAVRAAAEAECLRPQACARTCAA